MNDRSGPPPSLRATYRLQFSKDFRFDDARRIVPYLSELGISHVYASPLLMARPGSTHGYDIVDHNRLNPEIGDFADFDAFVAELHRHDMGLILDFVPNHMGVGPDNSWWADALEWGQASPYAAFFDIEWAPPEPTLAGKALLPVLGDHYGAVLERGELRLSLNAPDGSIAVVYAEGPFPIAPWDYPGLLQAAGEKAPRLAPLITELQNGLRDENGRRRQVVEWKRRFAKVLGRDEQAKQAVEDALDELSGRPGQPETFDGLHRLLDRQSYRLAYWRVAAHEINYRRFFDINDLAGLRMEQADLFEASHRLIRRLLAEGKLQGLRLDHVDGLRDPKAYFERLQDLAATAATDQERPPPLYVVVEKILAPHENLRADWAISGSTGYEFMAETNGLFVDPAGERPLTRFYERLIGHSFDFKEMVVEAKLQVMNETLASELTVLANLFNRIAKQNRDTRDFSLTGFREALANVVAHFPVYRTYVTENETSGEDRRDIDWAVGKARRFTRARDTSIYDFIHAILTLDILKDGRVYHASDVLDAAFKFQQHTGPVMAKAMEDTTFYRYVRLSSLNEVGGEPGHFGTRPSVFHESNRRRLRERPFSMTATATHDHKRGEDVRARLNVLSEEPREWARRVLRWMQMNERKRRDMDGRPAPSQNDEYLFYQTVVGAWPYGVEAPNYEGIEAFGARIDAYMIKAVREAKLRSSWTAPNEDYESALSDFVTRVLDPKQSRPFIEDIHTFVDRIAVAGAVNGLAQTLLKLVSPGTPDTYQGAEFWDFSLVDPDNRRPVDYEARRAALRDVASASCGELMKGWRDGRIKQYAIHRVLDARRSHPALFATGECRPLEATGPHAERVVALARIHDGHMAIAVAPRLVHPLVQGRPQPSPQGWDGTCVQLPDDLPPNGVLIDVISGKRATPSSSRRLDLDDVLSECPIALLLNDSG